MREKWWKCRRQSHKVFCLFGSLSYFLSIFLIMLLQLPHFSPHYPLIQYPQSLHYPPLLSSCLWVIHVSSFTSPFPILLLISSYFVPTSYAAYSLYLFPHSPPHLLPIDNPLCDLYFSDSVPILVVGLVCFCLG